MILNGKGWCYLAVKKLSAWLRRITYKYHGVFLLFKLSKLELHQKVYEIKSFCIIIMLSEDTKKLEFNQ